VKGERHELPCIHSTSFGSSKDSRLAVEVEIELPEVARLLLIQPGKKASSYASKHALGSALSALFEQQVR